MGGARRKEQVGRCHYIQAQAGAPTDSVRPCSNAVLLTRSQTKATRASPCSQPCIDACAGGSSPEAKPPWWRLGKRYEELLEDPGHVNDLIEVQVPAPPLPKHTLASRSAQLSPRYLPLLPVGAHNMAEHSLRPLTLLPPFLPPPLSFPLLPRRSRATCVLWGAG